MGFDVIGFSEAAPGTGTVGIAAALGDTLYRSTGDQITLRREAKYLLAVLYLAESTAGYARVKQPSHPLYFEFINGADLNTTPGPGFNNLLERPVKLNLNDKVEMIQAWSNNASDEDTVIALWVGDGAIYEDAAQVMPDAIIRGTVDFTQVANTWTAGAVTWSQIPRGGSYAIIGLRVGCYKASGYGGGVARLTGLKGQPQYRPGVPLELATGDKVTLVSTTREPFWSRWPIMKGIECEYDDLPNIEVLSPIANTDCVCELALKEI